MGIRWQAAATVPAKTQGSAEQGGDSDRILERILKKLSAGFADGEHVRCRHRGI